jgi:hypothetical protein
VRSLAQFSSLCPQPPSLMSAARVCGVVQSVGWVCVCGGGRRGERGAQVGPGAAPGRLQLTYCSPSVACSPRPASRCSTGARYYKSGPWPGTGCRSGSRGRGSGAVGSAVLHVGHGVCMQVGGQGQRGSGSAVLQVGHGICMQVGGQGQHVPLAAPAGSTGQGNTHAHLVRDAILGGIVVDQAVPASMAGAGLAAVNHVLYAEVGAGPRAAAHNVDAVGQAGSRAVRPAGAAVPAGPARAAARSGRLPFLLTEAPPASLGLPPAGHLSRRLAQALTVGCAGCASWKGSWSR